MNNTLRKNKLFLQIYPLYCLVMTRMGLFKLKSYIRQKLWLKRIVREDEELKRTIQNKIFALPFNLLTNEIASDDFIFSLTSYGKRVYESLPYALYSLIVQSLSPKKIVVYLDNDNWSDDKLPLLLQHLKKVGVDIRYCKDIKSYKKLLPALKDFPNNPIITLDDDFYYNIDYHLWMRKAYDNSNKKTILGQWGCIPKMMNGKYLPYSEWKDCKYANEDSEISFFGSCCCYPPHVFDDEIFNEKIFMTYCPTADDIWFWAMEERLKIKKQYITPYGYGLNRSVNRIVEYEGNQQDTLMFHNVIEGKNDKQLRNVIDYYHLENK